MSFRLLITTYYRNADSIALSTEVVDYALEKDAERVHFQINSEYSNCSDYQRTKVEATRLYPYKVNNG